MAMQDLVIYGAGGFAREVAWLARSIEGRWRVAALVDDDTAAHGRTINGFPVMGLDAARAAFPQAALTAAVGDPALREKLVGRAAAAGFACATLVHPRVEMSEWVEIGEGTVVCAGNLLTTNIVLGRHVQINLDCTVGHDVVMGDFTTLAPGAHISGWVHFGRGVYVGTGAVIINGHEGVPLTLGDGAVVGAGACVTKSVAAGTTVVGVPAKPRG
jgi:sugar O-acyltransferase (sialic acid O-acetyltransferase NeuD family)